MRMFAFLGYRVRGFRVLELGFAVILTALVLVVYLAKAGAGGTRADIDHVEQQITEENGQIRLLRAEVASEEQPERLAALSSQLLHLAPIAAKHEIPSEALADLARLPPPKPADPAVAAPVAVTPAQPAPATAAPAPALAAR